MNFWKKLKKPIFVLAPMANVTDAVFRKIIAKYGKPDVIWTEFVSADGLISPGKENLLVDLQYSNKERPIVAQLFTGHVEAMRKASKLAAELDFDGIDINMGCPDRAVEKQGGGAYLIKNYKLAIEIINSARQGIVDANKDIPLSVKTRIGYNKVNMDWLKILLEQKLPVLTLHLRTRKEMSDVPAHWELMPAILELRDKISPDTLIIGNGDVESPVDGLIKIKKYGGDGVMIGRGIFGKPWLFGKKEVKDKKERLKILLEHSKLFDKTFKDIKNFAVMKKHFKAYVSGWDGAKELRNKLMETSDFNGVKKIIDEYLKAC